jgi:hypothetical protein
MTWSLLDGEAFGEAQLLHAAELGGARMLYGLFCESSCHTWTCAR